jgi:hypothetical protein
MFRHVKTCLVKTCCDSLLTCTPRAVMHTLCHLGIATPAHFLLALATIGQLFRACLGSSNLFQFQQETGAGQHVPKPARLASAINHVATPRRKDDESGCRNQQQQPATAGFNTIELAYRASSLSCRLEIRTMRSSWVFSSVSETELTPIGLTPTE